MVDPKLQKKGRSVDIEPVRWLVTVFWSGAYETLEVREHPVEYLRRHPLKVLIYAMELGAEVPVESWEGSGTRAFRSREQKAVRG